MTTCEWLIEQQKSGALRELHPGALGLSGLVLLVLLLVASYTDLRWRLIRNHTTYPAILFGLLLNGVLSSLQVFGSSSDECVPLMLGGIGISQSLLGGLLCFGGMSIQFLMFGTGAGDVKLMAALGVLLGWRTGLEVWLCTMLLAASCFRSRCSIRARRSLSGGWGCCSVPPVAVCFLVTAMQIVP